MTAVDAVGCDGWPEDTLLARDEAKSDCYAKRTTSPADLRAVALTNEWPAWERAFFASLLASLAPLEVHYGTGVRVLLGRD